MFFWFQICITSIFSKLWHKVFCHITADIRIMHPNAPSYINKPIEDVYTMHENEKKKQYNERVIQIEEGSFTPIVGSTIGSFGKEADRHHKRMASLIAAKTLWIIFGPVFDSVFLRARWQWEEYDERLERLHLSPQSHSISSNIEYCNGNSWSCLWHNFVKHLCIYSFGFKIYFLAIKK